MFKWRRKKQSITLTNSPAVFTNEPREHAALASPERLRDELIRKERRAKTAKNLEAWANSPSLQRPK
jgi:hypothetical protein